jgi:large subunit ribosomal protein L21
VLFYRSTNTDFSEFMAYTKHTYSYDHSESEVLFVFAVIETGGKQYKVNEGDVIFIEKLEVESGEKVTFDKVLALSNDGKFSAGAPYVAGASVVANVIKNGKGKKIHILKYKSKKNEKKKIGHRQPYTKVQIEKIVG